MSPLKKYWPSMTALLLASCALPGATMAQQAAPRGEAATVADVVVTGVRASQKAAEAVEFGNQVQVIRAEEIRASGATNMAELMQFLAKGVNIGYSPDEGEYTIRLDGGGDRDTLVVLDGVPLYDRGPALEDIWGSTTIDPHMIERVEVFRGGNSLFFGSNGGVGVISLVTKKPDGTTKGEIGVTYGSFETRELWANYSFPLDKDGRHSLMVYGSELATDGPRIFDPTKFVDNVALAGGIQTYALNRNNIGAKYLWKIDPDTELLLNAQYTELWFQDAFPNTEVFSPNTTRYPIIDAAFSHRWNESVLTEVNAYYSNPTLYNTELYPEVCLIDAGCVDPNNPQVVIPKGAWTGAVEPFLRKGFGEGNQNKGGFKEYGATVRNTLNFGSHFEMVAGAQWVRFQNDSDPVYFVGNEATTVTGLFVDARPRLPFSPDTAISLAVRTDFSNAFDSKTIWKFGFRQPLPGGFYVRANGGTSYSLPRNTELYRNFDVPEGTPITVIGNPNLRPEENSEPNNLRCWVKGEMPEPGYTYQGSALTWPTIPDVLEAAGVDWKFYQDPNNNWTGAMHGGLAFDSFRTAKPGSPLYEKGMRHWSLEQLEADVKAGTLPAVSWILPPRIYSEHPSASTPIQGAEFTARVLDALTANPEVWSKTVFFLTFDENDGQFDHLAPPSVPSYRADGTLAGKSTVDVKGLYFNDDQGKYLHPDDKISGAVRPWGLGPRVPLYIVSPWSKGGWVNSEVADHTSVGQFIEKRFGVTIPAISAWHRSVCSDLVSAFDFGGPSDAGFPALPDVSGSSAALLDHLQRPRIQPPSTPQPLFQEPGVRPSRALPYMLEVGAGVSRSGVTLNFVNTGAAGAVFQVYDKLHLDRIPQRYTVEAGKALDDQWALTGEDGGYDLWVLGPNGFLRTFKGQASSVNAGLRLDVRQNKADASLTVTMHNKSRTPAVIRIEDAYRKEEDVVQVVLRPGSQRTHTWRLQDYGSWYDLVFVAEGGFERRLAGRLETGMDSMSDPLMGSETGPA